ncbi:hypothetical protein HK098_007261 [Nowakowskiella sp. JEL0407]|nr:hypothetical protein HK098_007261 [Nowakowskiella sp. JEL0407]
MVVVPFFTSWIWHFNFNPLLTDINLIRQKVRLIFGGNDGSESTATEMDAKSLLQSFTTSILEGQIIWIVAIIIGLSLILLKEYIVLHTPRDGLGNPIVPPGELEPVIIEPVPAPPPPPPAPAMDRFYFENPDLNPQHVNIAPHPPPPAPPMNRFHFNNADLNPQRPNIVHPPPLAPQTGRFYFNNPNLNPPHANPMINPRPERLPLKKRFSASSNSSYSSHLESGDENRNVVHNQVGSSSSWRRDSLNSVSDSNESRYEAKIQEQKIEPISMERTSSNSSIRSDSSGSLYQKWKGTEGSNDATSRRSSSEKSGRYTLDQLADIADSLKANEQQVQNEALQAQSSIPPKPVTDEKNITGLHSLESFKRRQEKLPQNKNNAESSTSKFNLGSSSYAVAAEKYKSDLASLPPYRPLPLPQSHLPPFAVNTGTVESRGEGLERLGHRKSFELPRTTFTFTPPTDKPTSNYFGNLPDKEVVRDDSSPNLLSQWAAARDGSDFHLFAGGSGSASGSNFVASIENENKRSEKGNEVAHTDYIEDKMDIDGEEDEDEENEEGNMGDNDSDSGHESENEDGEPEAPLLDIGINLGMELPGNRNNAEDANANNGQLDVNINLAIGNGGLNAEINANGDVNAFLELLGIEGPIEAMFTNALMMLGLIFVAIGAGVVTPWVIGKTVVIVSSTAFKPTVEAVDVVLEKIADGVLVYGVEFLQRFGYNATVYLKNTTIVDVNSTILDSNFTVLGEALNVVNSSVYTANSTSGLTFTSGIWTIVNAMVANYTADIIPFKSLNMSDQLNSTNTTATDGNGFTGDSLVNLLASLALKYSEQVSSNVIFPNFSEKFLDTFLHIILGYASCGVIGYIYARDNGHLRHPYVMTFFRLARSARKYTYSTVKFTFIIFMEIIIFPFFCGVLVDLCTLPLFGPTATVASRYNFYLKYPWVSRFMHWVAGTTFMYSFAVYISVVREIFRPGVMWFVSDEKDNNFINELLEKPIKTQLRKFAIGAIMYAILVISCVGGFVGSLYLVQIGAKSGVRKILPLKWDWMDSLADFPIDLILYRIIVPFMLHALNPATLFRAIVTYWFEGTARYLRLTSFLFGGRHYEEESDDESDEVDVWAGENPTGEERKRRLQKHRRRSFKTDSKVDVFETNANTSEQVRAAGDVQTMASGSSFIRYRDDEEQRRNIKRPAKSGRQQRFLRVPNHDSIKIIPKLPVMIPMRANEEMYGRPNEPFEDVLKNWTKVYMPPHIRVRLYLLMIWQWISGIILALVFLVTPLIVGRIFFLQLQLLLIKYDLLSPTPPANTPDYIRKDLAVPDIYSWSIGTFISVIIAQTVYFIGKACMPFYRKIFGPAPVVKISKEREAMLRRRQKNKEERARRRRRLEGLPEPPIQRPQPVNNNRPVEPRDILADITNGTIVGLKLTYLFFWAGIVIPLLIGRLVDIYLFDVFRPMRQTTIHFVLQYWALGALYTKIFHSLALLFDSEARRALIELKEV